MARGKKLIEPQVDLFKLACARLRQRPGLNYWEQEFIASNINRDEGYEYTDAQHACRIRIDEDTFPVGGVDGYSNAELIRAVAPVIPLRPYDDEVWFKALVANDTSEIAIRDARKLIAIARGEDRL